MYHMMLSIWGFNKIILEPDEDQMFFYDVLICENFRIVGFIKTVNLLDKHWK